MEGHTLEFVEVASPADVVEGQMRAVDVKGKRILLTRVEGVPYALGAVCTHERANLDDGTLMGHELYCPLHFSCFDVRTGEALAPPADRPTPVYAVREGGGRLLVSSSPVDPESLPQIATQAEAGTASATQDETEVAAREVTEPSWEVAVPRATSTHQRLIEQIEEMSWLESASESLGTALRPLREGRLGSRLFDLLHGRVMGHALHPALSDLPLGLWAGALLLEIVGESDAAGILVLGGVVAGVAAAATGVADWTVADGRDRRLGLMHGILQTVALVIVTASLVTRYADALLAARLLLAGGLGLALSSAYLGGHLVFGRGVMVDRTAWTLGPRGWIRVIKADELGEGDSRAVEVEGRQVLVSRSDGVVSAIEATCTHAGGPLAMGKIEKGTVTCPWHLSCFRLRDGAVLRGPATHPQPMLEARARGDWIELRGRKR